MNFSVNILDNHLLESSYRIPSAYTSASTGQAADLRSRAVESVSSRQYTAPSEEDLETALSTFSGKTLSLYESFHSFQFPEGDLTSHYRSASVSDPEKMTAQAALDATPTNYLVDIDRLATSQTHRSRVLPSEEITDLAEGTYTFTLTVGDTTHSLDVNVNKTGLDPDTHKDVLKKLGRRISQADDSLEAFVAEVPRKVYSTLSDSLTEKVAYLTVRNKNTGDATHFSLEDDSGTIIDTLGVDQQTQSGQPAQVRLNSFLSGAGGNTAVTDNGKLTFEFSDTTQDPVTITVKAGLSPVREKIVDLLIAFNGYLGWLDEKSLYFKPSLKTGILEEMGSTRRTLESIGLRYDENGMIYATDKFDDTLLTDSALMRDALTGEEGFFTLLSQKLGEIMGNGIQNYATFPRETGIDILV